MLSVAYVAPGSYETPVETDRQLVKALYPGPGRRTSSDFTVTPGAGLSINIGPGTAVLHGSEEADQGAYFVWSSATANEPVASPSSLPRVDTLIMRVADPQYGTVSTPGPYFEVIQGSPAASGASARSDTYINTNRRVPGAWMRVADFGVNPGNDRVGGGGNIQHRMPLWYAAGQTRRSSLYKNLTTGYRMTRGTSFRDNNVLTVAGPVGSRMTVHIDPTVYYENSGPGDIVQAFRAYPYIPSGVQLLGLNPNSAKYDYHYPAAAGQAHDHPMVFTDYFLTAPEVDIQFEALCGQGNGDMIVTGYHIYATVYAP